MEGTWRLLRRHGRSWQQPARRAVERDGEAVGLWKEEVWPQVKARRRPNGAWIVCEDEAGQSLRPPRARSWGRVGRTPVVRVRARGSGRVSTAGRSVSAPETAPG
uniref:winged helix-turn-helix domain-containing protein n=1 Tax=Streptomyces camponoticapitis TaxID=1616125 RepID=UPI0027E5678E|nr:winged helix-turn-helix domain-containing protein [Streptomyces camponoticapitis]